MYDVIFQGGESRYGAPVRDEETGMLHMPGCDFMLVEIDGNELYAERTFADLPNGVEYEEDIFYNELKKDILSQASELGIDVNELSFWYD